MQKLKKIGPWLSGAAAGIVNGLFGAGGGMVLLPLLSRTTQLRDHETFASCVCIVLPLSLVSAGVYLLRGSNACIRICLCSLRTHLLRC